MRMDKKQRNQRDIIEKPKQEGKERTKKSETNHVTNKNFLKLTVLL